MPRRPVRTRVYLRNEYGDWARFCWIYHHQPNEPMIGFHSLEGGQPRITTEYPEQLWTRGDPPKRQVRYDQAQPVDVPLDHFTCHADGRFHARTRGGKDHYVHVEQREQPIAPTSGTFLDMLIATDQIVNYKVMREDPKTPHLWVRGVSEHALAVTCRFAGAAYPLVDEFLRGLPPHLRSRNVPIHHLAADTIQGVMLVQGKRLPPGAVAQMPRGTTIVFRWPRGPDAFVAKTFVIN